MCSLWPLDNLRVIASYPCGFCMSLLSLMAGLRESGGVPNCSCSLRISLSTLSEEILLLVLHLVSVSQSSVIPFDQYILDLSITFGQRISELSITFGKGISELLSVLRHPASHTPPCSAFSLTPEYYTPRTIQPF